MIPKDITADHVLAAIREIDEGSIPSGRKSKRYQLVHEGRRYSPKYVVSLAAKHATGRELLPEEFGGGQETNSFLKRLGFEIKGISQSAETNTSKKSPKPPRTKIGKVTVNHGKHCQQCKLRFLALLQALYSKVELQKRFPIGTKPQDFVNSKWHEQLTAIFTALQDERGFPDFVKAATLPHCDYFLPCPGVIVEFDEDQHFTMSRKLAISLYPPELLLGFDREIWKDLCCEINARDNDPPYRDEQRAWYDSLRDFLPTIFALKPTVRLYEQEYLCKLKPHWCDLDPDDQNDVELVRQILSSRAHFWTIEICEERSPKFGRIVMDGAWLGNGAAAQRLLGDVAQKLSGRQCLTCLSTCGAFITFDWPEELPKKGNMEPSPTDIDILKTAAERAVSDVLNNEIFTQLAACCRYLTLGVDTKKSEISKTGNMIREPHAELVCLVDFSQRTFHWTGKFYPTSGQAYTIVRFPDLESHFVMLDSKLTMILGCHDLNVFSNRGQANAKEGGWRRQVASEFRELAKKKQPVAILHHPHTTVKRRTWLCAWNELMRELPSVKEYLGTGAYSYLDNEGNCDPLDNVLEDTQRGEVLDIIVRLASCSEQEESHVSF